MKIENIPYSEFKVKLKAGQIVSVTLGDTHIAGTMKNPAALSEKNPTVQFDTVSVRNGDPTLIEELDSFGVTYSVQPPPSPLSGFLLSWVLPFALIAGVYYLSTDEREAAWREASEAFLASGRTNPPR